MSDLFPAKTYCKLCKIISQKLQGVQNEEIFNRNHIVCATHISFCYLVDWA